MSPLFKEARWNTVYASSLRYWTEKLVMDSSSPVLRVGGCLERQIDMQRTIADTLSELRTEWASWISLWNFLAHHNDPDF
jgi:hypothetical protein